MAVACCVTEPRQRSALAQAVQQLGWRLVTVQAHELGGGAAEAGRFGLIVHDLAPWSANAVTLVGAIRQVHALTPILLYVPPHALVGDLLVQCGRWTEVRAHVAFPTADSRLLREALESAIVRRRVAEPFAADLEGLLGSELHSFLRQAAVHLDIAKSCRDLSVSALASGMRVSRRTLERWAAERGLPKPAGLLDGLIYTSVLELAEVHGLAPGRAAVLMGVGGRRFRALRRRVLLATENAMQAPEPIKHFWRRVRSPTPQPVGPSARGAASP